MTELPGALRRTNWVVSRRFLRHGFFEVPEALPENKRASALLLQVRRWAPFAQTRFASHWVGHRASVYAWDGARMDAAVAEAGELPLRCVVWPETFFRAPLQDGVRLANMIDGVEGQAWRDGLLTTSRWWANAPSSAEWALFLRSAGITPTADNITVPAISDLPLLELPWTEDAAPIANAWALLQDPRVAAGVAAILAAPVLYYLTQIAVMSVITARVENTRAALTIASQGVRNDRSAALANLDAIDAYLGLQPYPSQFQIVARATQLMRDKNVTIAEWNYDNGNLDMTVRGTAALDASAFIEMFEHAGMFSDVSATTADQERELRLKARVKRSADVTS